MGLFAKTNKIAGWMCIAFSKMAFALRMSNLV